MVLKDWSEMQRDIDKQNIKSVTALKHLIAKIAHMQKQKAQL
jgi:hypothetical protein